MADPNEKAEGNAPGKFYVDQSCIDCSQCPEVAPQFFMRNDEMGYSFVHRQPENEAEIAEANEAMEGCPTESIGCDG